MFTNDSYDEISNRVNFEIINPTASVDDNDSSSALRIYPNPVKSGGNTFIESKYPIEKIDLYDMLGNLFYTTKNVNEYNYSLINQNLPTGTYILRVYSNRVYNVKIVIQ